MRRHRRREVREFARQQHSSSVGALYVSRRSCQDNIPEVEGNCCRRSAEGCCVRRSSTMSWWRRVQQAFVKPSSTNSLKKNVSENLSFLQKKYGDLAKDKGEDLRKTLKTSVSDYGKRAKNAPQDLKARSAELGRQARVRAEKATSGLGKQLGDSARAFPSKTAEVAAKAAQGAAAAGAEAAQNAASAGAKAATDAGRRATSKARDAMPKVGAYANETGRRIAYVLLGTAFLYGLGSSLPGAVGRYYTEKDRRRGEEAKGRGGDAGDGGDSLSSARVGEARGALGGEPMLLGIGMVEQWLRDR